MSHAESGKVIEERLAIVLEGLKESSNIAKLCRRHGISQSTYYSRRDKFVEGGKTDQAGTGAGCRGSSHADKARIVELERVIGQQAVEIQVFKKTEPVLSDHELLRHLETEGVPVAETCRILGLSRSSYYRRRRAQAIIHPETHRQEASEPALLEKIRDLAGKHPIWGCRVVRAVRAVLG